MAVNGYLPFVHGLQQGALGLGGGPVDLIDQHDLGEDRTLAEFEFMRQLMDVRPILLLDDIFDKFDAFRVKQIISLVAANNFGQIFITDTNQKRLYDILKEIPAEHFVFSIENGKLSVKEHSKE